MLEELRDAITKGDFVVTNHANTEMESDNLTLKDVIQSTQTGEVIEEYPKDLPFPSCLVFGKAKRDVPIHTVWAYDETSNIAILVTTYIPDPGRWIDFRIRR